MFWWQYFMILSSQNLLIRVVNNIYIENIRTSLSKLLASYHAGCIEGKFCCLANNFSHNRNVFIACFGPLNFSSSIYESYMYVVKIASGSHHRGNNVQQEFNMLATYFTSCVGHRWKKCTAIMISDIIQIILQQKTPTCIQVTR